MLHRNDPFDSTEIISICDFIYAMGKGDAKRTIFIVMTVLVNSLLRSVWMCILTPYHFHFSLHILVVHVMLLERGIGISIPFT